MSEPEAIAAAEAKVRSAELTLRLYRTRARMLRVRANLAECRRDTEPLRVTIAEHVFRMVLDEATAAQRDFDIASGTWKCDQCSTTIPHSHYGPLIPSHWNDGGWR